MRAWANNNVINSYLIKKKKTFSLESGWEFYLKMQSGHEDKDNLIEEAWQSKG